MSLLRKSSRLPVAGARAAELLTDARKVEGLRVVEQPHAWFGRQRCVVGVRRRFHAAGVNQQDFVGGVVLRRSSESRQARTSSTLLRGDDDRHVRRHRREAHAHMAVFGEINLGGQRSCSLQVIADRRNWAANAHGLAVALAAAEPEAGANGEHLGTWTMACLLRLDAAQRQVPILGAVGRRVEPSELFSTSVRR